MTNTIKARSLGVDTYNENILFLHADNDICKSEGLRSMTRVVVKNRRHRIVATLNMVRSELLSLAEAGFSLAAMERLHLRDGDPVTISHLQPLESLGFVRGKMYGKELTGPAMEAIVQDIVAGNYSNLEIGAFATACAGNNLSTREIIELTRAMLHSGKILSWEKFPVLDKHSIGGIPGNRTTPIVVSIIAAAGLTIPKSSSRAITSPAGTADCLETITNVNIPLRKMQRVVAKHGGCFVWGGAMNLSPADDLLIAVEKSLDVDSTGQMIASVLSKKIAAGSTHVLIDIPVGPTAKVRSAAEAAALAEAFRTVAAAFGLKIETVISDGHEPIGRGVGPALEALDVLAVLKNEATAPAELSAKALNIAARLLVLSGKYNEAEARRTSRHLLRNGDAYRTFRAICKAQGRFTIPTPGPFSYQVRSAGRGTLQSVDNRRLGRVAKLAGAPASPGAGLKIYKRTGDTIAAGELLLTIFSASAGELEYAAAYLDKNFSKTLEIC